MAFLNRVRQAFGHRWAAFFGPVAVTLGFIGLSIWLIPDTLDINEEETEESATTTGEAAAASKVKPSVPPANSSAAAAARKHLSKPATPRSLRSPLRAARPKPVGANAAPVPATDNGDGES